MKIVKNILLLSLLVVSKNILASDKISDIKFYDDFIKETSLNIYQEDENLVVSAHKLSGHDFLLNVQTLIDVIVKYNVTYPRQTFVIDHDLKLNILEQKFIFFGLMSLEKNINFDDIKNHIEERCFQDYLKHLLAEFDYPLIKALGYDPKNMKTSDWESIRRLKNNINDLGSKIKNMKI